MIHGFFDQHEIDTSIKLDGYEQARRSQEPKRGDLASSQPPTAPHNTDEENVDDTESEDVDQGEPSSFDILQDDTKDELDEDQQE